MLNGRKIFSIAIVGILSFTFFLSICFLSIATQPCTVRGYVYVDENITTPDQIKLIFLEQNITATILGDPIGYFIIDFNEDIGKTGIFYVIYKGLTLSAEETITIMKDTYIYKIDLHVCTPPNNPPNKPIDPIPENNSENIEISPFLSVLVVDPDDDLLSVYFFNASDDTLLGESLDVESNTRAEIRLMDISYETNYSWYAVANDSEFETKSDAWRFITSKPGNQNPPNKPTLLSPENGTTISSTDSATLKVGVTDPDGHPMDVSFYDNSDDSLIGKATNVGSGSSAEILWTDLNANTTYKWYAIANDSKFETRSDTWSFKTSKPENQAPKVCIIQPYRGIYLFNKKIFPRFIRLTLIIGKITVIANATDEDSGIEKVEFYINAKLKGNDTTRPFTYNWTRDQFRLLHIYWIKVVAYDREGATAQDLMLVRRYL